MTNRDLPEQAFVGGFEDEIIYVARSVHNRSLCPGKYIPSQHRVFVPWGGEEHAKEQFDVSKIFIEYYFVFYYYCDKSFFVAVYTRRVIWRMLLEKNRYRTTLIVLDL